MPKRSRRVSEIRRASGEYSGHTITTSVNKGQRTTHERHEDVTRTGEGDVVHTATETENVSPTAGGVIAGSAGAVGGAVGSAASGAGGIVKSHTSGAVLFWSIALLMMATWKGYWKPTLIDTVWNGQPWNTTIPGHIEFGGIVFALALAMISDVSDDAEHVIVWMLVALWLLFLLFNGLPSLKSVTSFLTTP